MSKDRTKQRFGPLVIKAQLESNARRFEGYLTNVSTTGAFLATDEPPDVGNELHIRAVLPWKLGELRARGRVVWRKSSENDPAGTPILGAGVAFTELEHDSEALLVAYLERFAELAGQLDEEPTTP